MTIHQAAIALICIICLAPWYPRLVFWTVIALAMAMNPLTWVVLALAAAGIFN